MDKNEYRSDIDDLLNTCITTES